VWWRGVAVAVWCWCGGCVVIFGVFLWVLIEGEIGGDGVVVWLVWSRWGCGGSVAMVVWWRGGGCVVLVRWSRWVMERWVCSGFSFDWIFG
jgi:hypothetical protein